MQRCTRNDRSGRIALALAFTAFVTGPLVMAGSSAAGTFDGHPAAEEAGFDGFPTDLGMDDTGFGPVQGEVANAPGSDLDTELARFEAGAADLDFPESIEPVQKSTDLPGTPAMDSQGNRGHIHVVRGGDTLWDISTLYLETPWTWPAIWTDNRAGIANPHRIFPGDRIWISPFEMRRISPDEADDFIAAAAAAPLLDLDDAAAWTADDASLSVAGMSPDAAFRTIRVSGVNNVSFVSAAELEAATSIVESPAPRVFLSQGDPIYIGLGQGETEVGERYTIFREAEEVRDFQTNALYGYHIDLLGWVEVQSVGPETSVAKISMSTDTIERGDRIIARHTIPLDIDARPAPSDVDGRIIYMPASRTQAAATDFVYLDRGTVNGLQVGHLLEVYDPGGAKRDRVRGARVTTPDWNVATLIVTSVQPDSAVAFVTHARRELSVGDIVRSTSSNTATAMR